MVERYDEIVEMCTDLKIEFVKDGSNKAIFRCAHEPSDTIQEQLKKLLPGEFESTFIVGPKAKTIHYVQNLIGSFLEGVRIHAGHMEIIARKLLIEVVVYEKNIKEDHPFFKSVTEILVQDGFFEGWVFNNTAGKKHVFEIDVKKPVELSVRPERDTAILPDEITDLMIVLNDPRMTWDKLMEIL